MIEPVRSFAIALADGVYGVNVQLAGIPVIGGHAAPPAIADILTSDDDAKLADGVKDEVWPKLVLLDDDTGEWEAEVGTHLRDGDAACTVLYVPRDRDDAATYRNASYTRRAIKKTLRAWLANTSYADRTIGSIYVIAATVLRDRSRAEDIRGIPHAGGLTLTFRTRDQAP